MVIQGPEDEGRGGGMTGSVIRAIAGCFSLAAFATAIIAGMASGNDASVVLVRAMIAMFACYPLGLVTGVVAQRIIAGHVRAHLEANPLPEDPEMDGAYQLGEGAETGRLDEPVLEA